MAFSRDLVEVLLPPTVRVKADLWELHDIQVISVANVASSILALKPNDTKAMEMV